MRLRSARKVLIRLVFVVLAGVALFVIAAIVFAAHCQPVKTQFQPQLTDAKQDPLTADVSGYARPEDDTFLTYPEWYIVWSYQEKADFQQSHLPASFPYYGAIAQYWHGYCCAYAVVRGRYPFNVGDHVMLAVIGTSFTLEYALKGAYENTIGRLSEWSSGHQPTDEDGYAYRVAREYGDFVHIRPFYEFSFFRSFRGLWHETTWWGPHVLRKWERKFWLSLDYATEAAYCGLIELASHASYGVESPETYARIENAPKATFARYPRMRLVKGYGSDAAVVMIPRYQEFTEMAIGLSKDHVRFVDIAGNNQVLLTVIGSRDWKFDLPAGELLFSSDILTHPELTRFAVRTPVGGLSDALNLLADHGLKVEHVYDY
jgi:hypothetical protein